MRRTITLLLTLALLLIIPACGNSAAPTGGEVQHNIEIDRSFVHGDSSVGLFCGTEDTIYFAPRGLSYIFFADKETGIGGPLCGKPECMHNDAGCNAYVSRDLYALSVYDGRLYWVGRETVGTFIYSAALDGTDRKTVREIEKGLLPNSYSNVYMLFHRGYAYLACVKSDVRDGEAVSNHYVCAFPLDPDEEAVVILDEYAMPSGYVDSRVAIQPYGDSLYIVTDRPSDSIEDYTGINPKNVYDFRIMRWNTGSTELEILYQEEESPLYYSTNLYATDDGVLFCRAPSGTFGNMSFYKYSFDGGEPKFIFNMGEGVFGNIAMVDNVAAGSHLNDDGSWYVLIKDHDGNTLVGETYLLDLSDWPDDSRTVVSFFGADATCAYFGAWTSNGHYGIITVALDGSGARVLCSEEDPAV